MYKCICVQRMWSVNTDKNTQKKGSGANTPNHQQPLFSRGCPGLVFPASRAFSRSRQPTELPLKKLKRETRTAPHWQRSLAKAPRWGGGGPGGHTPGMRAVLMRMSTSLHCWANSFISASMNSLDISLAYPPCPSPDSFTSTSKGSAPRDLNCSKAAALVSLEGKQRLFQALHTDSRPSPAYTFLKRRGCIGSKVRASFPCLWWDCCSVFVKGGNASYDDFFWH